MSEPRERAFTLSFALTAGALLVSALAALAIPGRATPEAETVMPAKAEVA